MIPPLIRDRPGHAEDLARAENIINTAAAESGWTREELMGPSRRAHLAWSRHMAMAAIRRGTGLSFSEIAQLFNWRHHSSVMYACRRMENAAAWRPEVDQMLDQWARL